MKKLFAVILILALIIPAVSMAAEPDPIVGAWYLMLDYTKSPYEDSSFENKNYMIYVLFFEEDGTVSGFSGESIQGVGFYGAGTIRGTWLHAGDIYAANISGFGTSNPTIEDGRLILWASGNIYYSMRRLEWSSWTDDLIYRE